MLSSLCTGVSCSFIKDAEHLRALSHLVLTAPLTVLGTSGWDTLTISSSLSDLHPVVSHHPVDVQKNGRPYCHLCPLLSMSTSEWYPSICTRHPQISSLSQAKVPHRDAEAKLPQRTYIYISSCFCLYLSPPHNFPATLRGSVLF